jgi:hypothetical protein
MLKNLFRSHSHRGVLHAQVHRIIAFPAIVFLALAAGIFSTSLVAQENAADETLFLELGPIHAHAHGLYKLQNFTSVDAMKLTKDVVRSQPSQADINSIVEALAQTQAKYIAISVPLDPSSDYPAPKPAPLSAESFTAEWANAIHEHGLKVLWRGTWSGLEGLYDFPKRVGANRFPAGNAATAATDNNATWLGKTYAYIVSHPDFFRDGDIWAPLPERTEGIFQDGDSFLPYDGGIQANYAFFFNDLKTVSNDAFAEIGKKVITGWTANNFSEVDSGWIFRSVFNNAGLTVVDYYGDGAHSPEQMDAALRSIYAKTGHQVFLMEWSDYWDGSLPLGDRQAYLDSMYSEFLKLANDGVLMGFNYWGGWSGAAESILVKIPGGGYRLNTEGQQLAAFFAQGNPGRASRPMTLAPFGDRRVAFED